MSRSNFAWLILAFLAASCVPAAADADQSASETPPAPAAQNSAASTAPAAAPQPTAPATFIYSGALTQGGWIRGTAPAGTIRATLDGTPLDLGPGNAFFGAFDRDAGGTAELRAVAANGTVTSETLTIMPRAWNIERVNVARRSGGASEAFLARRRPELAQINGARGQVTGATGYSQNFIWPVTGRISGRFGSQRIYRGEPGSYHSGIDIAPGNGVPFVAPADGVVVLAASNFSLEGGLLIIDHGAGLNSAFLHASKLAVGVGDVVKQGQYIGNVGATGRATGPHLHWGLKWRDARLDPLLFTGPMP